MRLANEAYALEAFGVEEEGEFRIARSGKAFRALIDGLYADKHQSIVRELSANAFDSHKRVGQVLPFYIHVPCDDRAEFFIRDYGVGMTHKTVMNLYSTMFESDKIATDDEVGMFGLGSKTPFAYTDQFYVTCYDGAESRHYIAAIGPDGVPRILRMGTEECDEPCGVRVGFAVEHADFASFRQAVEQIVLGYEPRFEANIDLSALALPAPVFQGPGWAAYPLQRHGRHKLANWNVRQGCVIYPVEDVGGVNVPRDDKYTYLFDAPIGKVTVTTSRERVEYKPTTVQFLNEQIKLIQTEVRAQVWSQVVGIRSVVDFFTKIQAIKPSWLAESYTHPITQLTSANIQLGPDACLFDAVEDSSNDRWSYNTRRSIQLTYPNICDSVYIIDDLTPLHDPERPEGTTGLTKTEHRRLARYARAFANSKDTDSITLAIGVNDWSADFWDCALPKIKRHSVTIAEMKASIPKRVVATEGNEDAAPAAPIRGLGVARANGETSPVFSIEGDGKKAAWVKAEVWRSNQRRLQAVAKRFGVETLYIASPTAEEKCSEIRTLRDAVLDYMKPTGIELADALKLSEYSYYNKLAALTQFGIYLLKPEDKKQQPRVDLYEKLCRTRGGLLGEAFRFVRPYIEHGLTEFDSDVRNGITETLFNRLTDQKLPPLSKKFTEFESVRTEFTSQASSNLMLRFFDDLNYGEVRRKVPAESLVEALIALNRITPIEATPKS